LLKPDTTNTPSQKIRRSKAASPDLLNSCSSRQIRGEPEDERQRRLFAVQVAHGDAPKEEETEVLEEPLSLFRDQCAM
jgi:hypothetical protein